MIDLKPGRLCWIVSWAPAEYAGKQCIAIGPIARPKFYKLCTQKVLDSYTGDDWWQIEAATTEKRPAGTILIARTLWLIPIPDDDEARTLFASEPDRREVKA